MISYITWKIIDIEASFVNILTQSGVWYEVHINELTYSQIYNLEKVELYIHHSISENFEHLFWFLELQEKKVFRELLKISGIGWKVAIQILSLWVSKLVSAVNSEDYKAIQSIKWVWKKMSEKIVLELKDKDLGIFVDAIESDIKEIVIENDLYDSIKSSLIHMWYNPKDVDTVLTKLPETYKDASEIIPFVIKELS